MEDKEINLKLKACKTVEELKAFAKEIGYELTDEEAVAYFKKLTESGELSDDELSNVSGGTCFRQRNREIYCIKKPQYLIVFAEKSCRLFESDDDKGISRGICRDCDHLTPSLVWPLCCGIRTYYDDPLNPYK